MRKYIITTDNTTDLPEQYYVEHNLEIIHLSYVINDEIYDGINKRLTIKEFYEAMRDGAMPFTQQANPEACKELFEKKLSEGFDIIHIAFTSGLSGTYNSSRIGAEEALEKYPDGKITVIDSLCASMGEGLLVHEALKRKDAGMDYDTLVNWIEDNKLRLVHEVVADDLFHLHRGGRVSKAAAVVGTTLGVKPIIHVNDEGKLVSIGKQRHMKVALKHLANRLAEKIKMDDCLDTIAISHSDSLADAEKLASLIQERVNVKDIIISDIGPTIGSHTGIGTIAVFYFADSRAV